MFLYTCEILSTIAAAYAGSIASSNVRMDLFGVMVCGSIAALGGGTTRDVLLGLPIFWTLTTGTGYLVAAFVTCFVTFFLVRKFPAPMGTIRIADAFSLALFAGIGLEKSQAHGFNPLVGICMGICTGVAGGLLRDVLTGNVPYVFRAGELYATAAFFGCTSYVTLRWLEMPPTICFSTCFAVTLFTRLAAIRWRWNLPTFRPMGHQDFGDKEE